MVLAAEFNSLDEACVAVQAEQAGDDATWMPLAALLSADMFHNAGSRVGFSKNRLPAIPGALLAPSNPPAALA